VAGRYAWKQGQQAAPRESGSKLRYSRLRALPVACHSRAVLVNQSGRRSTRNYDHRLGDSRAFARHHRHQLRGRLVLCNGLTDVEHAIRDPIKQGSRKLVLDFSRLSFIDSAGIGVLAMCVGIMEREAGKLVVAGGAKSEVNVPGLGEAATYMRWAANGKGWYVTVKSANASHILKVDLTGRATQLILGNQWADAIPSPDRRHVALWRHMLMGNVWMLENF